MLLFCWFYKEYEKLRWFTHEWLYDFASWWNVLFAVLLFCWFDKEYEKLRWFTHEWLSKHGMTNVELKDWGKDSSQKKCFAMTTERKYCLFCKIKIGGKLQFNLVTQTLNYKVLHINLDSVMWTTIVLWFVVIYAQHSVQPCCLSSTKNQSASY